MNFDELLIMNLVSHNSVHGEFMEGHEGQFHELR